VELRNQSRTIEKANLVSALPEGKTQSGNDLSAKLHFRPEWEWTDRSPLTNLLNTAAEFEIDIAMIGLDAWLQSIENGNPPYLRSDPTRCIRLCETTEGLALIKWTPTSFNYEIQDPHAPLDAQA
jgi:hypothetical protein